MVRKSGVNRVMNKEEYIKYVQNNEELSRTVGICSNINAIVQILIDKGICTVEEYGELKQKYEKKMLDDSFMKMIGMGD